MMRKYNVSIIVLNFFIALLILLRNHIVFQAIAAVLGTAVICAIISHVNRLQVLLPLLMVCCAAAFLWNCWKSNRKIAIENICWAQGVLCQDSSVSSKGGTLYSVRIMKVRNSFAEATASSNANFYVSDSSSRGMHGDVVEFHDIRKTDSDGFYFAGSCNILNRNAFRAFRNRILVWAEKRLMTVTNCFRYDSDVAARGLAMKLLFGRNISDIDDDLNRLVKNTGLAFVFALSGMHLNVAAVLVRKLLRRIMSVRCSAVAVFLVITAYFALASRSASFVRAYLMFVLSHFIPGNLMLSLPLSFLLQNLLFPMTVGSMSFDWSYLAVLGIFFFHKSISAAFRICTCKFVANYVSLSISAVSFSAIVGLMAFDEFRPMSLAIGPAAAFLASGFVVLAILLLFFNKSMLLSIALRFMHSAMMSLLKICSAISPDAGAPGFACMILVSLLIMAFAYLKVTQKK